jgi:hypothetical protein
LLELDDGVANGVFHVVPRPITMKVFAVMTDLAQDYRSVSWLEQAQT